MKPFSNKRAALCALAACLVSSSLALEKQHYMFGKLNHFPIKTDPSIDNDAWKSLKEIIKENGYAVEQHYVTTEDGYILTLFRLPGFANETAVQQGDPIKKPVVLLQHGLESDAAQWLINTPDKTHAFMLANEGYDVWMGNNRGS